MPSVLCTASTFSHIVNFHLPYLRRFRELGWQVSVACGGIMRDIPFADVTTVLPLEKKMSSPANFRAAKLLRERNELEPIVTAFREYEQAPPTRRWLRSLPAGQFADCVTGPRSSTWFTATCSMMRHRRPRSCC